LKRFETEIIENILVSNDYVQERNDCVKIYVSKPLNISFSYSLRIILTIDYISLPICSEKTGFQDFLDGLLSLVELKSRFTIIALLEIPCNIITIIAVLHEIFTKSVSQFFLVLKKYNL